MPAFTSPSGSSTLAFGQRCMLSLLLCSICAQAQPGQADADNAVVQSTDIEVADTTELVEVEIDWSSRGPSTTRRQFSLAGFSAFSPAVASDPRYHEALAYAGIGLLRYHNTAVMRDSAQHAMGWVDHANRRWDSQKIRAALAAWNPPGVEKLICIPEWPTWMDADGDHALDPDQFDAFATWCADLVRIANMEGRAGVKYWEITNERDNVYWLAKGGKSRPRRQAELADIFLRAARAMKAVDPSIKTGGPSATRGDLVGELRLFVRHAAPQLDFLSVHAYASGRLEEPDASIFAKTAAIGRHIRANVAMLREEIPGRHVETHLNEYNISWTWKTREPRMLDHRGAVFDALCLIEFARAGLDAGNAWNERDGVYGKMDQEFRPRPALHVYHYFNTFLTGASVGVSVADSSRISAFAVHGERGPALALVNFTSAPQQAALRQTGAPALPSTAVLSRVDASGLFASQPLPVGALAAPLTLPPCSVAFVHAP